MKICRFCKSKNIIKHSIIKGKQRYECKKCGKYQLEKDNRQKYSKRIINTAFILFSEGNNYRRTARILSRIFNKKISYQLVLQWIQKKVDEMPENINQNVVSRDIEIVEMDELFTFFKKKLVKSEYGLLLTETLSVCLHFGQVQAMKFRQEEFGIKSHIIK
jgi:transposase-like protein